MPHLLFVLIYSTDFAVIRSGGGVLKLMNTIPTLEIIRCGVNIYIFNDHIVFSDLNVLVRYYYLFYVVTTA